MLLYRKQNKGEYAQKRNKRQDEKWPTGILARLTKRNWLKANYLRHFPARTWYHAGRIGPIGYIRKVILEWLKYSNIYYVLSLLLLLPNCVGSEQYLFFHSPMFWQKSSVFWLRSMISIILWVHNTQIVRVATLSYTCTPDKGTRAHFNAACTHHIAI